MDRKLQELPDSLAHAQARVDLAVAMDLLMQVKATDASARLDAIKQP